MSQHIAFFTGLLLASVFLALCEIQLEGRHGWAGNLPTWKIDNRWTRLLYSKRPLTGYHLFLQLSVFVLVHMPYTLGFVVPSLANESRILGFMILLWLLEDFLWFVLNPAFGIRKFKAEYIWWHKPTWTWVMPRDYWVFGPIGIALYVVSWLP